MEASDLQLTGEWVGHKNGEIEWVWPREKAQAMQKAIDNEGVISSGPSSPVTDPAPAADDDGRLYDDPSEKRNAELALMQLATPPKSAADVIVPNSPPPNILSQRFRPGPERRLEFALRFSNGSVKWMSEAQLGAEGIKIEGVHGEPLSLCLQKLKAQRKRKRNRLNRKMRKQQLIFKLSK